MREILFKAKSKSDNAWHIGGVWHAWTGVFLCDQTGNIHQIDPQTICQFTGVYEFNASDLSINGRIFENDIVEVWSRRRVGGESYWAVKSDYDGPCVVRAQVVFQKGKWRLDYNNPFNEKVAAARGKEQYDRYVDGWHELYDFGATGCGDVDRFRKFNPEKNWYDIRVIGNVFDNPELLKGD